MKTLPDKIKIRFSEKDRQSASFFTDRGGCLIHTSLKRMGYNHDTPIEVAVSSVQIGKTEYKISDPFWYVGKNRYEANAPYYHRSVVGKRLTLEKVERK